LNDHCQRRRSLRDRGTRPPIFGLGSSLLRVCPHYFLHYLRSQVKPSCLYFTCRNVQLSILCNVLFVCMVGCPLTMAVMVKIRCIFQLISAVDFMALYFTRKHINALMLTKKLRFLGPPTRALPVDPAGGSGRRPRWGACVPIPHGMFPSHGDRSTRCAF